MTDDDVGLLLIAAIAAAALSVLLAASKRWNPSNESWLDEGWRWWGGWRFFKRVILFGGCGSIVVGLVTLLVQPDRADGFIGAGVAFIATRYVVGFLFWVTGSEDEI